MNFHLVRWNRSKKEEEGDVGGWHMLGVSASLDRVSAWSPVDRGMALGASGENVAGGRQFQKGR